MVREKEKIIAIIPARGGSKSIPKKNIQLLGDKPLIAWPIETAKSVKRIDRIIVSSDDDEIISVAKHYGAETPFKRPKELAQDQTPTLPVIEHCLLYLRKREKYFPDIILLLYSTAPFLKKAHIEEALNFFERNNYKSVLGVTKDYGRFWKYREKEKKYKPFYPETQINRQYYKPLYRESGTMYFSRIEVIMEKHKLMDEDSIAFILMDNEEIIDIDTPSDFLKAEKFLKTNPL